MKESRAQSRPGFLLARRHIRRLLLAQLSSTTALYALGLAGVVLIEQETQSSAQTGVAIVASILPAFLGSMISGAVVDRWGKVPVLLGSHLAKALVALAFWLAIPLLPLGGVLALVYTASAGMALFAQFAMPAQLALLPDLAGSDQLLSANTFYQFGTLIAEGVGIVLVGPLIIKLAGAPAIGLFGFVLCILALGLVATLPRRSTGTAKSWPGWTTLAVDLRSGWATIARDRILRVIVLQATLAAALLLVVLSFLPGLAARHLGLGVEDTPWLILPGGLGFVLGSILVNRWEARLSRPAWISYGLAALGVALGLLAITIGGETWSHLFLSGSLIVVIGVSLALIIIPSRAELEERPPPDMRGRVIAAQLALGNAAAVIPLLLGGTLADAVGIPPVMAALGLLSLIAGAAGLRHARGRASQGAHP